jgi:hypothetical protein
MRFPSRSIGITRCPRRPIVAARWKARRASVVSQPVFESLERRLPLTADAIALEPIGDQIFANAVLGPPEAAVAVAVLDETPLVGGAFLAVWQSYGEDGTGYDIFAQVFDRDGVAVPGFDPVQVNQPLGPAPTVATIGNQLAASAASDGEGRFVIGW